MTFVAARKIRSEDIAQPLETLSVKTLSADSFTATAVTAGTATARQVNLEAPGTGTAQLKVIASQKIGVVNWANTPYLLVAKAGDLVPVFFAKKIEEVSATGATELDRTFVLAESIPPNIKLLLYLRADVYNNAGATSCVRAYFSDATVELCTTATAYTTLTGSAEVSTLKNDWLVLDISRVDSGTAYVKLACAVLVPKAG